MSYFEFSTPEAQGISSAGLIHFLDEINRASLELHRLMIIRHGVCVAKACAAPYQETDLHPLFSFSKSFTSTAIGFAVQEGLLSLSDKVVDIFPDLMPTDPSENLQQVTVRDLLTMSCGQETELWEHCPEWLTHFFAHPFPYKPGTFYLYNTAGTNVLAAVIKRKTGQDMMSYLKPRLFDPLAFGEITCHCLSDPEHTCMGGAGMKIQLEDMAKFTYFMLRNGEWEGQKLLSGWYEQMGSKQIETLGDSFGHVKDWALGYGYQCWMCSLPGSYRADGAFGQFGLVFPTLDLIVITNMATEMTQTFMDIVNETLLPAVTPDGACGSAAHTKAVLPENPSAYEELTRRLADLHIPAQTGSRNPAMEEYLAASAFAAQSLDTDTAEKAAGQYVNSFDTLIGGSGLFDLQDDTQITAMRFAFHKNDVAWTVTDGDVDKTITASLANTFSYSTTCGHTYAATACWRSYSALEMEIRRMDALSGVRMIFHIDDKKHTITMEINDTLLTPEGGLGITKRAMPVYQ